jgi:hypothetical protein
MNDLPLMLFHSIIPESPLFYLGILIFKLICYSLFIWFVFPKFFKDTTINPIIPAICRTVLGFVCGVVYLFGTRSIFSFVAEPGLIGIVIFVTCLLILRMIYWYFIIWIFYDKKQNSVLKDFKLSILSLLFSLLIDIPAGLFGLLFYRDISLLVVSLVP